MVLTDRQRADLHAGIYEYLLSRPGPAFQEAAAAFLSADPESCSEAAPSNGNKKVPLLEKKWTAIPRLQKKVLELERIAAQSAKVHAHRSGAANSSDGSTRRMLPRLPASHRLQGHASVVTSVAVHPVFTMVASGSEDGTVKLWDHESGEYMRTLKGHTNTVTSVTFTPKGTHLASSSADISIKLWDLTTFACLRTLRGHDHTISSVRFIPMLDGINPNDATAGLSLTSSNLSATTGIDANSAGCKLLISASRDHTVKVWDIESGFCDQTLTDHSDWVRCLAVRQDGALWASSGNDQAIHVYDNRQEHVVELRGHEHVVETIAFVTEEPLKSPSAAARKHTETVRDYLASGSRDRTVKLWKVSQAACIATFTSHENWVRAVLIHPSGNYLISSSDDKSIRVFDIKANRCLRTLEKAHDHFVSSLDMHHTLPILVSGGVDQSVRCWQLE